MPNPFTYKPKPKPYTLTSLTNLKNLANRLFQGKKYQEAIVQYEHLIRDFEHNEEEEMMILQMKGRLNLVACILELERRLGKKEGTGGSKKAAVETGNSSASQQQQQDNDDDEPELPQRPNLHKYDPSTHTIEYALSLCEEILKCPEASSLHIKAIYRKVLLLELNQNIEEAMKQCSEAMKRFPNASFFRQLFERLTKEEAQRRQDKLPQTEKAKLSEMTRFSVFGVEQGGRLHSMHINDKKWSAKKLDTMAEQSFQFILQQNASSGNIPESLSIFHFNTHNSTAHISHVQNKKCETSSSPDKAAVLDECCRSYFDLDMGTKRNTFIFDATVPEVIDVSNRQPERLDSTELEQYQQLAMVMRDRYGNGVTVDVMKV